MTRIAIETLVRQLNAAHREDPFLEGGELGRPSLFEESTSGLNLTW